MELHVNDLLTRPQIGPLREQELRSNGYVRIRRGVYLPESLLPDNAPRWEIRRLVTQARALSISLTKRTAPSVLSLESALSVRGISAWTNTVDISYRVESHLGQRKPLHLNAVSTRNVDICSVTERPILSDPCRSQVVPVNLPTGVVITACLPCEYSSGGDAHRILPKSIGAGWASSVPSRGPATSDTPEAIKTLSAGLAGTGNLDSIYT